MRIGFMQGRLSPPVDGRIQAFPGDEWREEFPRAASLGFGLMEWTLDAEGLDENPLMTVAGRHEIRELCAAHGLAIPSLTGDFLMQASPLRSDGSEREARLAALERVIDACGELGVRILVWPLVDKGSLEDRAGADALVAIVSSRMAPRLRRCRVVLAFESDYGPADLSSFIARLSPDVAGINYDTGNSAALGYRPAEELGEYGDRVINLHLKDRLLGGGTVRLGSGVADFEAVFRQLRRIGYEGHLILQTARATDGDHAGTLCRARDFVVAAMRSIEAA